MNISKILLKTFLCFSCLIVHSIYEILGSEVPRPRGVSLSRASLYSPENDFTCFDNSKTIPFSQVNDDYCDCPDASDEPGTSACPHGMFYCVNAGHKPVNIGSSRVNDGICDCCDGSDEYVSGAKCINNCVELGQSAREEALQREELLKAGKQLREEFSQKGIQEKQQKKEKLHELERNKEEAERVKTEKETLKNQAEELENKSLEYYRKIEEEQNKEKAEIEALKVRTEASTAFNKYDINQDGKVSFDELQQHQTFDKDKNGEVTEDEAKYFLNEEVEIEVEKFISDAWSRIKPYLMIEAGAFKDIEKPGHVEKPAVEEPEDIDEGHAHRADDEEEEEDQEDGDDQEQQETEPQEKEQPAPLQYDEETQRLVDAATEARNEFSNAESAVRDIENEIKEIRDYLENDFGPDEEYAPLQGQCFDYHDHEYVYKLCPFDKTVQQPKSGSLETRLGSWAKWAGPDQNRYESMLYDKGQACWNGPQRSTWVKVSCGSENKVISVTEPNKCEYVFVFSTPAACFEGPRENYDRHDEL